MDRNYGVSVFVYAISSIIKNILDWIFYPFPIIVTFERGQMENLLM